MAIVNLFIEPLDPFNTIAPPTGGDQNSYYDDSNRTGYDVNSIWADYQRSYGPGAALQPIRDHYENYYNGIRVNLDSLASSFGLSSSVFTNLGFTPWFSDITNSSLTFQRDAAPLSQPFLQNYNIDPTLPNLYTSNGDIVVQARINRPDFSAQQIAIIRIDLYNPNVLQAVSSVQSNQINTPLARAISTASAQIKNIEAIFNQKNNSDEIIVYAPGNSVRVNWGNVKNVINNFEFNVISGLELPPGWGGATALKQDGSGWFSNVETSSFLLYNQTYGTDGLTWYMMHEISHQLDPVKDYRISQIAEYKRVTGDNALAGFQLGNVYFDNAEKFTNEVYRGLINNILTPLENPPGGYFPE